MYIHICKCISTYLYLHILYNMYIQTYLNVYAHISICQMYKTNKCRQHANTPATTAPLLTTHPVIRRQHDSEYMMLSETAKGSVQSQHLNICPVVNYAGIVEDSVASRIAVKSIYTDPNKQALAVKHSQAHAFQHCRIILTRGSKDSNTKYLAKTICIITIPSIEASDAHYLRALDPSSQSTKAPATLSNQLGYQHRLSCRRHRQEAPSN